MKRMLFVLLCASLMVGCGAKKQKKTVPATKLTEATPQFTIDQVYEKGDKYGDKTIVVTGTVNHVCKHGGKRCFLMGSTEDITLRVETGDVMKPFSQDQIGNELTISGILKEIRIDEKYLKEWEEEARADVEIDDEKKHLDGHEKGNGDHEDTELEEILKQIESYRKEMKSNGKGYVSRFFMEGKKIVTK
ncbi:hypothetical protein EMN47_01885 [Prolixibacteraceae bacterium JC049]|nr:hypothetical protein [Prolixibacteraceae bacterium JC049]